MIQHIGRIVLGKLWHRERIVAGINPAEICVHRNSDLTINSEAYTDASDRNFHPDNLWNRA